MKEISENFFGKSQLQFKNWTDQINYKEIIMIHGISSPFEHIVKQIFIFKGDYQKEVTFLFVKI